MVDSFKASARSSINFFARESLKSGPRSRCFSSSFFVSYTTSANSFISSSVLGIMPLAAEDINCAILISFLEKPDFSGRSPPNAAESSLIRFINSLIFSFMLSSLPKLIVVVSILRPPFAPSVNVTSTPPPVVREN